VEVLRQLARRLLAHEAGISAQVQGEVFGDAALYQVGGHPPRVCAERGARRRCCCGPPPAAPAAPAVDRRPPTASAAPLLAQVALVAARGGDADTELGAAQLLAAQAAHEVLCMLCTDPAHGLVAAAPGGAGLVLVDQLHAAGQQQPGRKVVKLLQRLEPSEVVHHCQLLQQVAQQQPQLAAELLHQLPYSLEPAPSAKWLVHMAVAGQLLRSAAAATSAVAALAGAGGEAPGAASPVVRNMLRRCLPGALAKGSLSRGVQHSEGLVQHATLCALCDMLGALGRVLGAVERAAAAGGPAAPRGWLCCSSCGRLPGCGCPTCRR
jgi:nucleolar pre-ribosomal-associated protein 1